MEDSNGTPVNVVPEDAGTERTFHLKFEPGQTLKIYHKINISYSSFHVTDCHFSNYSINKLDIRVRKPADCKFRPIPTFSSSLTAFNEDDTAIFYRPVKGLLRGQALIYLLDKEEAMADAHGQQTNVTSEEITAAIAFKF